MGHRSVSQYIAICLLICAHKENTASLNHEKAHLHSISGKQNTEGGVSGGGSLPKLPTPVHCICTKILNGQMTPTHFMVGVADTRRGSRILVRGAQWSPKFAKIA